MKRQFIAALLGAASFNALATDFIDNAPVISVVPLYNRASELRQECWTEYAPVSSAPRERSYGGAIVGGIAGGVLGNQIGGGRGRTAATAAGAVAGALVGDNIANSRGQPDYYSTQPVQRCRQVDDGYRQEISGFSVTYRYNGRNITTTLPYDPGPSVRVGVGVVR